MGLFDSLLPIVGSVLGGPVGGAIGTLAGGLFGAQSSANAANAQARQMDNSLQLQKQLYDQSRSDQLPFINTGHAANQRLMDLLGLSSSPSPKPSGFGKYAKDFSMSDFQQDPGYAFRLDQALKGINKQFLGRGGSLGGNALKAITNYSQDAASQEYQNAFNRYQVNRSNQLTPLSELANRGQNAAVSVGQLGSAYGGNSMKTFGALGDANAAGQVGPYNALSKTFDNINNQLRSSSYGL